MKRKETTIDDLAVMVKKGFDGMHGEMNSRFNKIDTRFDRLERGHEDINLRLGEVAYRFELRELERRV